MQKRIFLSHAARVPAMRQLFLAIHNLRHRHHPYMRRHPFDVAYGITTSGLLPAWLLSADGSIDGHAYAGCQPSCLRAALATIPRPSNFTFVDLGCGKGRALALASEFPFRRIVGIELSSLLAKDARANARIIKSTYPDRTAIDVFTGDATSVPLPGGDLVVFLYHSFGAKLVAKMLSRLMEAAEATDRTIFLIYENPVYGALVDDLEHFQRWYCETVQCTASEAGFAPDPDDTVVVWRLSSTPSAAPMEDPTAPIIITKPGWKVALAS
jgi:SAM-dependent methyltransferase